MSSMTLLQRLIGRPMPSRVVETAIQWYAHRRVAHLNREPAAEAQQRTLLRLIRQARNTRFGGDHDFGRIRTVADYQARVPLRDYEAFWNEYWQPAYPFLSSEERR